MSGNKIQFALAGVLLAAVGVFAGYQYMHSPNYVAQQQLKEAHAAQSAGHLGQAAELYAAVALSKADKAGDGTTGLLSLLDGNTLSARPGAEAAQVLAQANRVRIVGDGRITRASLLGIGWAVAGARSATDASGAKAVLDAVAALEPDKAKWAAAAEPLLERIVAAEPGNMGAASEYAELLERRRDCARCEAVLAPHAARLGLLEGARILGQIYAGKGMLDESYRLLQPYTEDKLKRFVAAEAEYRKTGEDIEKVAMAKLRAGTAPKGFYEQYDKADESTKREMVGNFVNEELSKSAELKRVIQTLRESGTIVPAALDLGIVTVQRAQKLQDPAARNAQFQAAEKVFLSIRGVAGNSDAYRLYLGQVDYWLGKQEEGKRLFDELLEAHHRQYAMLIDVSGLLRSVGAVHDARTLIEEAYRTASGNDEKWNAAHMRSLMYVDSEDELTWLQRADPSNPRIRASIHTTRATLADRRGQRGLAKREYEQAAAEFEKMPESATQLNSSAIIHLALYGMEGDRAQLERGLAQLDQALSLQPTDSILLLNNISAVSSAAAAAIIGDAIDLPALGSSGDFNVLEYLHNDEASRDRVRAKVRENDGVKKALAYSEKAALLAP